ncbi:hypothetical protein AG1IA_10098 [Rhizoctonia solani AG-1 IA]|uniref:Uncharacterized protein n=1 Tax=Thanatephorus cucumeris (strain AG1-IA) TaxID=983506 RepID=L8WGN0_THACA|nr:hypothetical protein AG1IA_10098 [Rhizoctonia solani AG-1 IA]
MSMTGTPRAHSPALTATTSDTARQDIRMSTTRDPKIAAQVAMLNSIDAPGGVTNGANVLHTLPAVTVTNAKVGSQGAVGGAGTGGGAGKEDQDIEMTANHTGDTNTTKEAGGGEEASPVVAREGEC